MASAPPGHHPPHHIHPHQHHTHTNSHSHPAPTANLLPPPPTNPFLTSLLNRTLRITTTDGRMFVGGLKCMDRDRNLILAASYEYRMPSEGQLEGIVGGSTGVLGGVAGVTITTTTETTIAEDEGGEGEGEGQTRSVEVRAQGGEGEGEGQTRSVEVRAQGGGKVQVQLQSRFLGLVVVPGEVIVKVELEESRGSGGGGFHDVVGNSG